jgi:hypothetical protein
MLGARCTKWKWALAGLVLGVTSCVLAVGSCFYAFDFPLGVCSPDHGCPNGQYCSYPDKLCGDGVLGSCVDVAWKCANSTTMEWEGVYCGCSGEVQDDICTLANKNVDLSLNRVCSADGRQDYFRCGYAMCNRNVAFCEVVQQSDGMNRYGCTAYGMCAYNDPAPSGPGDPDLCDCARILKDVTAPGCSCSRDDAGNRTVRCPFQDAT